MRGNPCFTLPAAPVSSHAVPSWRCPPSPHCNVPRCAASAHHVVPQHPAAASLPTRCPCRANTLCRVVPCRAITTALPPCPVAPPRYATCFPHRPTAALSAVLFNAVSCCAVPPRRTSAVPIVRLFLATQLPHAENIHSFRCLCFYFLKQLEMMNEKEYPLEITTFPNATFYLDLTPCFPNVSTLLGCLFALTKEQVLRIWHAQNY